MSKKLIEKLKNPNLKDNHRQSNLLSFKVAHIPKKSLSKKSMLQFNADLRGINRENLNLSPTKSPQKSNNLRLTNVDEQKEANENSEDSESVASEGVNFREELMEKFYSSLENIKNEDLELLNQMLASSDKDGVNLSSEQKTNLKELLEKGHEALRIFLAKWHILNSLENLKTELVEISDIKAESIEVTQEQFLTRYSRFKRLNTTLRALESVEVSLISNKQFALFQQLLGFEDLNILSAWEVFRKDKNVEEFVDTLFIIERTEFFLNRIENYDEIENTDSIEDQMQDQHLLKDKINDAQYTVLSKLIRFNDFYISGILSNFKSKLVSKEQTLESLIELADEKINEQMVKDMKLAEFNSQKKHDWRIEGLDRVKDWLWRNNQEKTRTEKLLIDLVKKSDTVLESIIKVYEINPDKGELWENISLLAKMLNTDKDPEVNKIVDILTKGKIKPDLIEKAVNAYKDKADTKHALIMDSHQMLGITGDEGDFCSSVKAFMK